MEVINKGGILKFVKIMYFEGTHKGLSHMSIFKYDISKSRFFYILHYYEISL